MDKKILGSNWMVLIAAIIVIVGFKLVTQAGQGYVIQNDGYAASGGLLILIGGILFGMHVASNGFWKNGKSKK